MAENLLSFCIRLTWFDSSVSSSSRACLPLGESLRSPCASARTSSYRGYGSHVDIEVLGGYRACLAAT